MILDYFKAKYLEKRLAGHAKSFFNAQDTDTLVNIARSIRALPKKSIPVPTMRFSYLAEEAHNSVAHGMRLVNWVGYFSGTALALGLVIMVVVASSSKPGSALYSYKSQGQSFRLRLVNNETTRAELQLEYAEATLQETQTVLNSNATGEAKVAALSDLSEKTQTAVDSIKKYAVEKNDSNILTKLETFTNKQAEVISQTQDPEVKVAAQNALAITEAGNKTIAEAKRLVAASNESTLAKLQETTQTIAGNISKLVDASVIHIDKDIIVVTKDTVIHSSTGLVLPVATLKVGQKVTVKAVLVDNVLTAQLITVASLPGKVKDAKVEVEEVVESVEGVDLNSDTEAVPETATGVQSSFLVEDPAPKYIE